MKVIVKDSHLNFGGVTYFRGHAEEIQLGSYGEKRTPLTKMNYLEAKGRLDGAKMKKANASVVSIDSTQSKKGDFTGTVKAIIKGIPVSLTGSTAYDKLVKEELKLLKISVMTEDMKRAINDSPAARDNLDKYGNDARVAHQVFMIIDAEMSTVFSRDSTVELTAGGGPVKATVGGSFGSKGSTTVEISPGTCFAYLLAKIDWKKGVVEDLDDDQWSFN